MARPGLIRQTLKSHQEISHLAMVHHETSTGLLNQLPEIATLTRERGVSLIVDAISSFGGVPLNVTTEHIDYLLSTSNKCLHGMAGLAWVICRREALEQSRGIPARSYYLNLYEQYRHFEANGQMQFTPPVQVVYALAQAIREFYDEGASAHFQRYRRNWHTLVAGLVFFIPGNLGVQDGGNVLLTIGLHLGALMGATFSIIRRLREGFGLAVSLVVLAYER